MKKINLIVSIAIVLLTISKVKSQDLTNYNLYVQNPVLYNPAYTIDNSKIRAFVNSHLQWIGFDGAPRTNTFGVYANPLKNMGFGLSVFNYKQGITSNTNVSLSYAYKAIFGEDSYLALGLSFGTLMDNLKTNEIVNSDLTDQTITNNYFKQNSFASRAGLAYHYKGFEAQIAMPQLYEHKKISDYMLSSFSYDFKLDNSWNLKPEFMYRSVNTSHAQYGVNLAATWQKAIWVQGGYQSNNSLLCGVGFNYLDFQIGYAYQAERSYISAAAIGTNEIQLVYRLGNKRIEKTGKSTVKENLTPANNKVVHDTVYVIPVNDNTKVVGTIINKSDNKPVSGTVTVSENNKEVQKLASNVGIFSLDIKSGKTYKFEASSDNYSAVSQTIEIPKKTLVKEVNLVVDLEPKVKITVVDMETKTPVNAKIIISSNDKIYQTLNSKDNLSTIKLQPGVYVFDYSADGYYSKKVTVDLATQDFAEQNIQLNKVKKEAFTLGPINFETNKSVFTSGSLAILDNFIKVLKDNPNLKFEISGHTDNVGKAESNIKLSQTRAKACVDYMISKGVSANQLVSKGYGETKPIVPNDTAKNRFLNRRVEAKIIE